MIKKEDEKILKYKTLQYKYNACGIKNKGNSKNNRRDRDHFNIV
jgi:hypothetical protein